MNPVDGLVVIDKPAGCTSHDVVARCRRIFGQRKVGHAGTLDPDATGVLLVGLGQVTRLLRFLSGLPKHYSGEVVLGVATSTLDASGEVTGTWDMQAVTLEAARSAAATLTGQIEQVPPMVSALKVGGRRLHELARAGIEVERPPRPVTVWRFDVGLAAEGTTGPVLSIDVECSSGTYVRSLAADLGTLLGGGAHLRRLRREAVGEFTVKEAVLLDALEAAPSPSDALVTPAEALRGLSRAMVGPLVQAAVGFGKVLAADVLLQAGASAPGRGRWLTRAAGCWPSTNPSVRARPSRRWCCPRPVNAWVRSRRGTRGRPALKRTALKLLAGTTVVWSCFALVPMGPAAASATAASLPGLTITALTVTPHRGLADGQRVTVRVTGGSYGTTYAVVDCDPKALALLLEPGASVEDACDSRHTAVMTVGANGVASASLPLPAILTTALGSANCLDLSCFVAIEALHSTGGASTLLQDLTFAAGACAAPGSCTTPADAWDPELGHPSLVRGGPGPRSKSTIPGDVGTPGRPITVPLVPVAAGSLTSPGSVTGVFTGQLPPVPPAATTTAPTVTTVPAGSTVPTTGTRAPSTTVPPTAPATSTSAPATTGTQPAPVRGEGLLRLALEAPGSSWGPGQPSSTVVDATLTDLTTHQAGPKQQFVLFWGSAPFVYAAFVGPVLSTDLYSLTLSVEPPAGQGGLSQVAAGTNPAVGLLASRLEVVTPPNPQYLAYAYAPVMYGRSTSALHDVPLLAYASVSPAAGGGHTLKYVIVWSHEDAGTGFLPFEEWGTWGRMTDIEDAISFTVKPNGSVSGAEYLWGGEPTIGFPDSQSALNEVDKPFSGTWWGHHPVVRDATGNNDFSDKGTTAFRFQLAPVGAPAPGQARDAVMDANPFTYEVMADEVARWYADISTNPASPEPGPATQYAIVDLDTTGKGVSSVAVDLELSGYPGWFRSDFGWGFPLVSSGHVRTVVKLPPGWPAHAITAVRVVVEPPSAAAGVMVRSLHIEQFTGTAVVPVRAPAAVVAPESLDVTTAP